MWVYLSGLSAGGGEEANVTEGDWVDDYAVYSGIELRSCSHRVGSLGDWGGQDECLSGCTSSGRESAWDETGETGGWIPNEGRWGRCDERTVPWEVVAARDKCGCNQWDDFEH